MAKDYEEEKKKINEMLMAISSFPVAASWSARESAKKKLIRYYRKADATSRGMVMAFINEKLSNVHEFRDFASVNFMKERKRLQNVSLNDISKMLYDYSSSIDGACYFLDLLADIDDEVSLKVLGFHLTRYLSYPGQEARILSDRAVKALGRASHPYALHLLLDIAESGEGKESFLAAVGEALGKWKEKLFSSKLPKAEKDYLRKRLEALLEAEEADVGRQYG